MIDPFITESIDRAIELFTPEKVTRIFRAESEITEEHATWTIDDSPKFFMQLKGKTHFCYPGDDFELNESEIVLISPYIPHAEFEKPTIGEVNRLIVTFISGNLQVIVTRATKPGRYYSSSVWEFVDNSFRAMALETLHTLVNSNHTLSDQAKSIFIRSFLETIREACRDTVKPSSTYLPLIEGTLNEVRDHISDSSLSVQNIALKLGCSPEHLSRQFSQQYGTTLKKYILNKRLELAETILINQPMLRISEVGYISGFSSPDYFCAHFKKYRNMSPTKFREINSK